VVDDADRRLDHRVVVLGDDAAGMIRPMSHEGDFRPFGGLVFSEASAST
jgi:hypothetical protein